MILPFFRSVYRSSESGNVFFAIFGAVAVLGILGASVMTFMKGPLATSVKITRQNVAENQMLIGAQVAIMAAASQADNGDCDGDTVVEPIPWRDAGVDPKPVGGGLVPLSIGINKKDPYGTDYGYCVWDHGTLRNNALCGVGAGRLAGTTVGSSYPVVALVSAGADKTFNTTCRTFADADSNTDFDLLDAGDHQLVEKTTGSDDIIFTYTYEEATNASGGLWSLKSGHPDTAVIGKDIEVTGTGMFDRLGATGNDYLELVSGMKFANPSTMPICNATNASVVRMNASNNGLEMCDGVSLWKPISGGDTSAFANNNLPCDATNKGKVRYNASTAMPEFCNGTQWLPFSINIPGVNLVINPTSRNSMNVDGAANINPSITGICDDGVYACGSEYSYSLTNSGTVISANINVSNNNPTNFYLKSNTCNVAGGNTDGKLSPNESCTIIIIPKSSGNQTYTGNLQIIANNNPLSIMQGTSTNFGCAPGRIGAGGRYASCGKTDPGTGATYDLIVMPGGCTGSVNNPTCAGGLDTVTKMHSPNCCTNINVCSSITNLCGEESYGARASVTALALVGISNYTFPAISYCDSMNYGGYTDWYLPARVEMRDDVWVNRAVIGGFRSNGYVTSHIGGSNDVGYTEFADGNLGGASNNNPGLYIRCARRENISLPTTPTDIDPLDVSFPISVTFTASASLTSGTVTISGILQPVSASITGGTGMNIIKNGVSTGGTTVSGLRMGDTLAFQMTGPAAMNTKNSATITIGSDTYTWQAGYADISRQLYAFVTSGAYQGTFGGLATADATCNQIAAGSSLGLSSSWKAMISDETTDASSRIPWNWGTLKTVDGTNVVTAGLSDLFDGTLMNPINQDESGNIRNTTVWTGSFETGTKRPGYTALGWTAAGFYTQGGWGQSAVTGPQWLYGGSETPSYYSARALYCVENIDSSVVDTTPSLINLPYAIQVAASSRQNSLPKIISGMSTGATTTLSVSATGGNPKFTVDGGPEVSSATVTNGSSIVFYMDAPATASASYKMTITSTTPTTTLGYWRVWSGAAGPLVKRVFVTSTDPNGGAFGGASGADIACQSRASAASLGGTWKAILSGVTESDWAINRVGYNWTELQLVDGTSVAYAPNLFGTLLNPIIKTEFGVDRPAARVLSGTNSNGASYTGVSDLSNLYNWTGASCSATYMQGNSSALSAVITQGYWLCQSDGALFCIEQ